MYFFATPVEQYESMLRFEAHHPVRYYLTGLFDEAAPSMFESVRSIPSFARSPEGEHIRLPEYLVVKAHRDVIAREVPQRRSGIKHAVDGLAAPYGVAVKFSSQYSSNLLIYGSVSPPSFDPESRALHASLVAYLLKGVRKYKTFKVSKEALQLARNGGRLAVDADANSVLDLKV